MNKKVFTLLLLTVLVLAQFSIASATVVDGDATITAIPDFSSGTGVDFDWAATGMAGPTQNVLAWARVYAAVPVAYDWNDCQLIATIGGTSDASGTFSFDFTTTANLAALANGDQVEFTLSVDDQTCATADTPDIASVMAVNYVDTDEPEGFRGSPPDIDATTPGVIEDNRVACNTFELWGIAGDDDVAPYAYAGVGPWNPSVTGTFANPAPIGADDELFSWIFTFPSTASGPWTMSIHPEDAIGNIDGFADMYRDGTLLTTVDAAELADCETFSDISGHADEVYVRYLASLGLISGFADGTFGPDNTLTRAEASALFEKANGYDDTMLPTSAPAGCDFTDVTATDWFAGWVWQACDDGFMNGVGSGLFDPNNLLTRGQVVTIIHNIWLNGGGTAGSYIDFGGPSTTLQDEWNQWGDSLRHAAWTDVSIGAYYAYPVIYAYEVGVADGTSATTFSPDQAATRGEFAKMLYRALSRTDNH